MIYTKYIQFNYVKIISINEKKWNNGSYKFLFLLSNYYDFNFHDASQWLISTAQLSVNSVVSFRLLSTHCVLQLCFVCFILFLC